MACWPGFEVGDLTRIVDVDHRLPGCTVCGIRRLMETVADFEFANLVGDLRRKRVCHFDGGAQFVHQNYTSAAFEKTTDEGPRSLAKPSAGQHCAEHRSIVLVLVLPVPSASD
jgi:hypothetical protein